MRQSIFILRDCFVALSNLVVAEHSQSYAQHWLLSQLPVTFPLKLSYNQDDIIIAVITYLTSATFTVAVAFYTCTV